MTEDFHVRLHVHHERVKNFYRFYCLGATPEAYLGPYQRSIMDLFCEIFNR